MKGVAHELVTINGTVRVVRLLGQVTLTSGGYAQSIGGKTVAIIPEDRILFIDTIVG